MSNRKIMITGILALLITGCTHHGETNPPKSTPNSFYGTYLFIGPCQTKLASATEVKDKAKRGIAPVIVSGIVKAGIDRIGKALKDAAEDDIKNTPVSSNLAFLSQISNPNTCIQIVRGEFIYAKNNKENVYTNTFAIAPNTKMTAPLQIVKETEELFIEILPIIHNNTLSFTPLEVRYTGYTSNDKYNKKPRELALRIGYSLTDKDILTVDGYTGSRLIDFGTLIPHKGKKQAIIKYVNDEGKLSLINQTQWLALPEASINQPITFGANIIETRKAGELSKFLAKVFEYSGEEIKTDLTQKNE